MKSYFILPCFALLLILTTSCDFVSSAGGNSLTLEESAARINENPAFYNGFLWKPRSESTGGLVVLTPNGSTFGRTQGKATLSGSFGSESAPLRHENHNGDRPHFYFPSPGASYGANITVQVPLTDGSVFSVVVPNGAERFEL
jgi:hypothetical protein